MTDPENIIILNKGFLFCNAYWLISTFIQATLISMFYLSLDGVQECNIKKTK